MFCMPRCVWPSLEESPLWNFGISEELHFFRRNEIISWGKNRTALFQTHNWEQSNLNLNWFLWPTPSHFDSIHIISVLQICPSRVWECCDISYNHVWGDWSHQGTQDIFSLNYFFIFAMKYSVQSLAINWFYVKSVWEREGTIIWTLFNFSFGKTFFKLNSFHNIWCCLGY